MRINEAVGGAATVVGSTAESTFQIANSAHSFQILSDTLYSRKVEAVIREVCTNGVDSHLLAKTDKKLSVHIPTNWETQFIVRDFGTGLSDEAVMEMYTTYFHSTKLDEEQQTGCFGLGSKSPFAYADSFAVDVWFEGVHRIYSLFKEDGIPKCVKLHEEESDEPSGLQVTIEVATHDVYNFQRAAKRVFKYFAVDVDVNIDFDKVEYTQTNEKYGIPLRIDRNQSFMAVMGNVAYPIDFNALRSQNFLSIKDVDEREEKKQQVRETIEVLQQLSGCHLFFDVGQIMMTPSRETLSYSQFTIDAIINHCADIKTWLHDEFKAEIDACENLYKARLAYVKSNTPVVVKDMVTHWNKTQMWDDDGSQYVQLEEEHGIALFEARTDWSGKLSQNEVRNRLGFSIDRELIFNDMKTGGVGRVRWYLDARNDAYFIKSGEIEDAHKVADLLGIPHSEIILTSKLEAPPRGSTAKSIKHQIYYLLPRPSWHNASVTSCWNTTEDFDADTGGLYLLFKGWYVTDEQGGSKKHPSDLSLTLSLMREFGFSPKVYGLKPVTYNLKTFPQEKWQNFWDYAKKWVARLAEKTYNARVLWKANENSYEDHRELRKLIPDGSKLAKHIDAFDQINIKRIEKICDLCELFGIDTPLKAELSVTSLMAEQYPILGLLDRWDLQNNPDEVKRYLEMIET